MKVIHNIEPIYNSNSKILILGSMPSLASRTQKFFYAHPQNRFWKVMEKLFEIKLLSDEDKKNFLLEYNIAMWDTIKSCDLVGASDASIKNVIPNDIKKIVYNSKIIHVFTTGKKAYEVFNKYIDVGLPVTCLPSPSAANASKSLDALTKDYSIIKNYL